MDVTFQKLCKCKKDAEVVNLLRQLRPVEVFSEFMKTVESPKVKPEVLRVSLRLLFAFLSLDPDAAAEASDTFRRSLQRIFTESRYSEGDNNANRTFLLTTKVLRFVAPDIFTKGGGLPAGGPGSGSCVGVKAFQEVLRINYLVALSGTDFTPPPVSSPLYRWYLRLPSPATLFPDPSESYPPKSTLFDCLGEQLKDPHRRALSLLHKTEEMTQMQMTHVATASHSLQDLSRNLTDDASVEYVLTCLEEVKLYTSLAKHALHGTSAKANSIGLIHTIASVAVRAANRICLTDSRHLSLLMGEVMMLYASMVHMARAPPYREVAPPRAFMTKAPGLPGFPEESTMVVHELQETFVGHIPEGELPHFGHDFVLSCMIFFLNHCESDDDVEHHISEWINHPIWFRYAQHSHFPVTFIHFMLHNADLIARRTALFRSLPPRLFLLLAISPHSVLPLFQRLLPRMLCKDTFVDVFLRILYLPLLVQALDVPNLDDDFANVTSLLPNDFQRMCLHNLLDFTVFLTPDEAGDTLTPRTRWEGFCGNHQGDYKSWSEVAQLEPEGVKTEVACRIVIPLLHTFFHVLLRDLGDCPTSLVRLLPHLLYSHHSLYTVSALRSELQDVLLHYAKEIAICSPGTVHGCAEEILDSFHQHHVAEEVSRSKQLRTCAASLMSYGVLAAPSEIPRWKQNHVAFFEALHDITWEAVAQVGAEFTQHDAERSATGPMQQNTTTPNKNTATTHTPDFDATWIKGLHDREATWGSILQQNLSMTSKPSEGLTPAVVLRQTPFSFVTQSVPVIPAPTLATETLRFLNAMLFSMTVLSSYLPELYDRCQLSLINVSRVLSKYPRSCTTLQETAGMLTQLLRAPMVGKDVLHGIPRLLRQRWDEGEEGLRRALEAMKSICTHNV